MRLWPLLLLLLLLPNASAGYEPRFYYLKDDGLGAAETGLLNGTTPNATQPSSRPIPVALPNVPAAVFQTGDGTSHAPRLLGPVYVGLWIGPSPVVKGNLTVTLYMQNGTQTIPLGNASISLDANASKAPDPATLVPPDPSDPQGALFYELSRLLPVITPPPVLLHLGNLDVQLNATDRLLLSFAVTAGGSDLPAAEGAAATIQYNSTLTPSFLYTPWFKADPARPKPSPVSPRPYVTAAAESPQMEATPAKALENRHRVPGPDVALFALAAALAIALAHRLRTR
jgi:hypothetical protein